jgi:class 3 adenylate cyclase/putative methionine-R-sulfoxide reductase with GAF domain
LTSHSEPQIGGDIALQFAQARESATREILQIISRSRDDEKPVFDAILENAARLCDAPMASLIFLDEKGTRMVLRAHWGTPLDHFEAGVTEWSLDGSSAPSQAVRERRIVHIKDFVETDAYKSGDPDRVNAVEKEGIRTYLAVPLMRNGEAIGCIALFRRAVSPFDDRHVDLVETFAAQAVIAIENVRQFKELETRLEREAATREILQVISQSRADEKPVLDVILENASSLCNAPLAFLAMANEARTQVRVPAHRGARPEFAMALADFNVSLENSQLVAVRAISEARIIRSDDLTQDDAYRADGRWRTELVETEGVRSILVVPLMRGEQGIGAIVLYRREVKPFSDDDVELVKSFAAQAVIAVDNVKQFKQLEARTDEVRAQADELQQMNSELETRVSTQVDELERLGRLRRFLSPQVADAVVSSGEDELLGSHRALIATLFCDMRGFTASCETAEPEEAIEVLQTYHEVISRLIHEHGAGVDHRAGDGIMVIFNDPLPCDDPVGDALRLALAMREHMAALCADWRKLGHRLGFGVGISLGFATVGMVGSEGRYDYTASGTSVNLASRLCDHAADGEILLSPRAFAALEHQIEAESAGELILKGINAPVDVFRVLGFIDRAKRMNT